MRDVCVCALLLCAVSHGEAANKLLMLMIDGFRWDYIQDDMPGFATIREGGVKAEYTRPEFPTVTLTNWFSLLSGSHPETHGLLNNYMYDEEKDAHLTLGHSSDSTVIWESAVPIYTNALLNKKKVHMYFWDPCPRVVLGVKPQYCRAGIKSPGPTPEQFEDAVYEGIESLKNGSADFTVVYYELLDVRGHFYGPYADPVSRAVRDLDKIFQRIVQKTEAANKESDRDEGINVVIVSDHGMTGISPQRVINVSETLDKSDFKVAKVSPPISFIWPAEGKLEMVYDKLQTMHPNVTAYKKEEVPKRWHIKNHYRMPPITLVADIGWSMINAEEGYWTHNNYTYSLGSIPLLGYHGYDNTYPEMRGVFMGIGPDFKKGYSQSGFPIIDTYLILNKVLGVKPMDNNATWSHVEDMLTQGPPGGPAAGATYITLSLIALIVSLFVHLFH